MKLTARIAALAMTAAALVATAAPAHAVGESTATTPTAYVGDNCIDQPVNYSVNLPADVKDWFLQIKPVYPTGAEGVSSYVGTINGSPLTGTTTIQICGRVEPRGTWTLQPILKTWTDAAGKTYYGPFNGTPSTFEVVGRATTSLSLKAKTKGNKVTAKSRLVAKTDGNTAPVAGQPVVFQKKVGKKWKTFKTVTTPSTGVAKAKFKARKKTLIRTKFAGAGDVVVGGTGPAIPAASSKKVRVG
ncbi:hypothetical protein [Nocardioides sp. Soil805]|uniref:hypothetical protein n=1 Tax=Nocardioides sp. Soil805 TaxID=1736416 RepID=UPI0007032EA4|nr:hypothetical protein [Nocardioides sp. Soil805]KRF37621.1 hypothetical protein ASG94_10075 [Nocardioides sp. Soil805]